MQPLKQLTDRQKQIYETYLKHGTRRKTAAALGLRGNSQIDRALKQARALGLPMEGQQSEFIPGPTNPGEYAELLSEVVSLRKQVKTQRAATLDEDYVKHQILKLSTSTFDVPDWVVSTQSSHSSPGVPTLFASDWHWGEVVDASQINHVNSYDLGIAHTRARKLIVNTIDLLTNHMVNPKYPGVVLALGGDMFSGDIHEELTATNACEIMPAVLDLFGVLIWCINALQDKFGQVFVPSVSGNHSRTTQKIRANGRNYTSFDWLLYCFLAKHFDGNPNIRFLIPNGPDALYSIYGHKYLLTHGDQFRGGDGMIGALGPIIRGDHKKRSRNAQIDMDYDTLLLGHWHQLIQLQRLIVNGSLVGYNSYANANNFGYEPPRQALWLTHPRRGITFSMPVQVDDHATDKKTGDWVSWKE